MRSGFFLLFILFLNSAGAFALPCAAPLSQLAKVMVDVYPAEHRGVSTSKPVDQLKPGDIVTNVSITHPSGATTSIWTGSTRGWSHLNVAYSPTELSPELLKGKKVLDVACGYGNLVYETRRAGVEIYGLDIAGNWAQKDWYHSIDGKDVAKENLVLDGKTGAGYFLRADAGHTGLQGGQFDAVLTNWGPFNYETDPAVIASILTEMARVTKPGGKLYLYGINEETERALAKPETFHLRAVRGNVRDTMILERLPL